MPSQMNNHLRRYVQEGIQKKLRLNSLIGTYQTQLAKTKEDVIDQAIYNVRWSTMVLQNQRLSRLHCA